MTIDLKLLEAVIEASRDGIVITDGTEFDTIYVNRGFELQTGYHRDEVIGKNMRFLQSTDRHQEGLSKLRNALEKGEGCVVTLRNYRKDGSLFFNELSISPVKNSDGEVTHFIGIQNDITERINAERELQILASHDFLTQLYNQHHFTDLFRQEFKRAQRTGSELTLILCRLQRFSKIMQQFGDVRGDMCLQEVAKLLRQRFKRATDILARYDENEFIIALPDTSAHIANELCKSLKQHLQQKPIYVDAATGLTVSLQFAVLQFNRDLHISTHSMVEQLKNILTTVKRISQDEPLSSKT